MVEFIIHIFEWNLFAPVLFLFPLWGVVFFLIGVLRSTAGKGLKWKSLAYILICLPYGLSIDQLPHPIITLLYLFVSPLLALLLILSINNIAIFWRAPHD
jgi:hypothetical protein